MPLRKTYAKITNLKEPVVIVDVHVVLQSEN